MSSLGWRNSILFYHILVLRHKYKTLFHCIKQKLLKCNLSEFKSGAKWKRKRNPERQICYITGRSLRKVRKSIEKLKRSGREEKRTCGGHMLKAKCLQNRNENTCLKRLTTQWVSDSISIWGKGLPSLKRVTSERRREIGKHISD